MSGGTREDHEDRLRGYGAKPVGEVGVGDEAPPPEAPAADLTPTVPTPSTVPGSGIEPLDQSLEGGQERLSKGHYTQDLETGNDPKDDDLDPTHRRSEHEQLEAGDSDYRRHREESGSAFSESYVEAKTEKGSG